MSLVYHFDLDLSYFTVKKKILNIYLNLSHCCTHNLDAEIRNITWHAKETKKEHIDYCTVSS